ncbi:hypothetical protein BGZ75_009788, partial [Mortierella antarctica]
DKEDKKDKKDKEEKKDKKEKKEKKDKKTKKEKKDKETAKEEKTTITSAPTPAPAAAAEKRWNDWSQADLGNEKQNDKFLRLLGAKKAPATTEGSSSSASAGPVKKGLFGSLGSLPASTQHTNTDSVIDGMVGRKVTRDLEKQFQDGLKIRQQMKKGRSVGLGFGY